MNSRKPKAVEGEIKSYGSAPEWSHIRSVWSTDGKVVERKKMQRIAQLAFKSPWAQQRRGGNAYEKSGRGLHVHRVTIRSTQ